MAAERSCPQCGVPLSAEDLEGLCPRCVGRLGFDVGSWIESPANESGEGDHHQAEETADVLARLKPEEAGDLIAGYKLMEQIGEGGFGSVWIADQERPVRRRVALKIIKLGMDTKEVIARFEQERQALAMMDHPHIAKVFDAGATKWGRPYFVMELVRGIKITEYCDQAKLPTAERLALFIQVCNAVQHAHQKGIIHRDLKPSNILVTLHDGVPVPKVIDFGVAKATQQQRLSDLTIYTQYQQMIGTPLYMSPEQAEMSGLDIDTRSDIYSLGVLLYELLTGRTPFDPEAMMKAGIDEMRRVIREQEPKTPSQFLETMAASTRTTVAQQRQSDPARLTRLLRGDLDWIVMKALDKDRARRYETANSFARDVQRHLRSEPVIARPPTQFYRLCKFARRKPALAALVGVSGLAVLALIGAAVAQVAFHSEQVQRRKLEAALHDTEHARKAEETQRKQKEAALVEAERARHAEAEARGEEARQRHIADAALAKAERNGYFRRIAFAHREWEANNVRSAEELLDECPPELRNWEWHYLKRLCRSELLSLNGFANGVQRVAITANGQYIAAVNVDGFLKVWDATTGLEDLVVGNGQQGIASVAFSPDGTHLATGNRAGFVERRAMRTAAQSWSAHGHKGAVNSLAYSADSRSLVSGGADGMIRVWNGDTGEVLQAPLDHGQAINSVAISSDGKLIVSASGDLESELNGKRVPERPGTIKIWDASTRELKLVLSDSVGVVHSLSFSPDGKLLASAHADAAVRMWNVDTGAQESIFLGHIGNVLSVAFSVDGSRLVSGGADRALKVWVVSEEGQPVTYRGHNGEVHGVAFIGEGRRAVSGSADGTIKLWDVTRSQGVFSLEDDGRTLTFNPNGDLLVSGRNVWNVAELKQEFQRRSRTESENGRIAFSPDGKLLANSTGWPKGSIAVWNVETRQIVTTMEQGGTYAVAFSPDGTLVASCIESGRSRIVKMWEAATGIEVHSFVITTDAVWDLAFSRDGKFLALATGGWARNGMNNTGEPGEVQIWDWKTPRLVRMLKARRFCVWSVAFSPDGKRLASSGGLYSGGKMVVNPGEVQVWNVESGEEIFNLNVPDNAFSVAFSPDGRRLVAANGKSSSLRVPRELNIWDMEAGLVAFTLRGFDLPVHGVAFSPDGKRIATIGGGTLKVFDAEKTEFDALPGLNRAYERYSEVLVDTKASPKARANALLNRSQVLRHLNRPAEAEADSRLCKTWMAATTGLELLHLSILIGLGNHSAVYAWMETMHMDVPATADLQGGIARRPAELQKQDFKELFKRKDRRAAYELADTMSAEEPEDPGLLNDVAWTIISGDLDGPRDLELADELATRANEVSKSVNPDVLDTLARVRFIQGQTEVAIQLQRQAVKLKGQKQEIHQRALESYEKGELPKPE